MKKTFLLTDAVYPPTRRVEAIKGDIKKYIKRERKNLLYDFLRVTNINDVTSLLV